MLMNETAKFNYTVYKVEQYVKDCILSIFRQGLSDAEFEVVLVNDGVAGYVILFNRLDTFIRWLFSLFFYINHIISLQEDVQWKVISHQKLV